MVGPHFSFDAPHPHYAGPAYNPSGGQQPQFATNLGVAFHEQSEPPSLRINANSFQGAFQSMK